jgi:non-heme chloroperoxidase
MSAADDPGPPVVPVAEQVARANESGRVPVVFIHGLWLLPSSWDRWATLFADAGYAPVSPGDPDTVAEAYAAPGVFADKTIGAAPFRGVLPLPVSALKAAFPVLGNPANRHRAVPLTYRARLHRPFYLGAGCPAASTSARPSGRAASPTPAPRCARS